MAITIITNPPNDSSINDEIWLTASSTNAGTTNFKFVFDVLVGGNLVARSKVFPNPTDTYGYFNSAPIIRNYITDYFEPSGNSILVASNNKIAVSYNLQIGEEVSGGVTTNLASGTYSGKNFYYPLFSDLYASGNVTVANVYNNALVNYYDNFLTERDIRNIQIKYNDRFYVSYYRYEGISEVAYVRTLSPSGSVVASHNASVSLLGAFNMFNLSAAAINTWAGSTLITENTYAYEFYIVSSSGTSRVLRLYNNCTKYTSYNVHFINRLGGWDTYNFNLVNRRSASLERESYSNSDWQRSSGAMRTYDAYNKFNTTKTAFSIRHRDKINLQGDYVNEMDYNWLYQLVASSNVYIEVQSMYLPMYITSNNYEYKILGVDKVFNLQIEAEIPKNITSQFR